MFNMEAMGMRANHGALDEDQLELRKVTAALARERYGPKAAEWDAARTTFPKEERRFLGEQGLLGIALPEEYGGSGSPLLTALVAIEEFAKVCRPAAFQLFEANTGPARVLSLIGSEEQRQRFLPSIVRGDATMAIGISEPEAGSAATQWLCACRKMPSA